MAGELPDSGYERFEYLERKLEESRARSLIAPQDHDNLIKMGAALQELSQCKDDDEASDLLAESIEVLGRARNLPNQALDRAHETLWLLGSAYTYRASIPSRTPDMKEADSAYGQAYFRQARKLDPDNELYRMSDSREQIPNFLIRNWGWGVAGATALAGLCALKLGR